SSRAVFTAIGINDEQVIYAAYQDGSMGNRLTVRYYNTLSGIWESMAEEGVSSGAADYISLASNAGEMYVVYQDKGAGNTASVRRLANNKGVWSDAGSGNVSDGAKASYTAVRADGSGAPLLLYRDDTQGGKAVVKRYDRSAAGWETVGGAAFSEA